MRIYQLVRVVPSIILAISLSAAQALITPCRAENKNGPLKSTISKNENFPPVSSVISPGQTFDQAKADSCFVGREEDNQWNKVPRWFSEAWQPDKSKKPEVLQVKNVSDSNYPDASIMAYLKVPPLSDLTGHYADSSGQTWEYVVPHYWFEMDDGKYKHHVLVLERQIAAKSDDEVNSTDRRIEFVVNPQDNKIVKVFQHIRDQTKRLLPPQHEDVVQNSENVDLFPPSALGAISHTSIVISHMTRQTSCADTVFKSYDEHGDLFNTITTKYLLLSPGRIGADSALREPDGRSLFEMFNDYLKKNGMADRLPSVESSANGLMYMKPGQFDYSKASPGAK